MIRFISNILQKKLFQFGSNSLSISIAKRWGVKIGNNCRIFNCSFGSEPFLVSIGNNCEITSGVKFITHDGATWIFRKNKVFSRTKYGPIIIKDDCMIGINSIIMPNIEIGPNSIVGAGSVVTKNIPPNTVYAGNPARFICTVGEYLEKCKANKYTIPNELPFNDKRILLESMFKHKLR